MNIFIIIQKFSNLMKIQLCHTFQFTFGLSIIIIVLRNYCRVCSKFVLFTYFLVFFRNLEQNQTRKIARRTRNNSLLIFLFVVFISMSKNLKRAIIIHTFLNLSSTCCRYWFSVKYCLCRDSYSATANSETKQNHNFLLKAIWNKYRNAFIIKLVLLYYERYLVTKILDSYCK